MSEFLLGQKYDVTYMRKEKGMNNKTSINEVTSLNLMFHHSTYLYCFFWTGSIFLKISKKDLIRYRAI